MIRDKNKIERISSRLVSDRFLGAEAEMIVHDLENENTTEQECYNDEIIERGSSVVFNPDNIEEAHRQEFDNCEYCIEKKCSVKVFG